MEASSSKDKSVNRTIINKNSFYSKYEDQDISEGFKSDSKGSKGVKPEQKLLESNSKYKKLVTESGAEDECNEQFQGNFRMVDGQ
jgi:hypothetical protein